METIAPSPTRTISPARQRADIPLVVDTVDPFVDPRSTTYTPPASPPPARWDLDPVRDSSAILISCASSSPGFGCGLRPSSTRPSRVIRLPSSNRIDQSCTYGELDATAV